MAVPAPSSINERSEPAAAIISGAFFSRIERSVRVR